ncbi:nucleoside deaminase [soil metagenome]
MAQLKYLCIMDGILNDEYFMRAALQEAKKAFDADEVPVGAVIVSNGMIIGRAHNLSERLNDVTAHAEMMAFTSAANHLGAKFLNNCTLYVTLEPCMMCAGAAYWTRISKVVFGATDEKRGYSKLGEGILHPSTTVVGGVLENECSELITAYFKAKR